MTDLETCEQLWNTFISREICKREKLNETRFRRKKPDRAMDFIRRLQWLVDTPPAVVTAVILGWAISAGIIFAIR